MEACFRVEKNEVSESNGEGDWPQPQDKSTEVGGIFFGGGKKMFSLG